MFELHVSAPFSLVNIDFPGQAVFAQGGYTFQGHPSCPTQRKENHLPEIVADLRGKAALPTYAIMFQVFFPQLYLAWLSMSGTCLI